MSCMPCSFAHAHRRVLHAVIYRRWTWELAKSMTEAGCRVCEARRSEHHFQPSGRYHGGLWFRRMDMEVWERLRLTASLLAPNAYLPLLVDTTPYFSARCRSKAVAAYHGKQTSPLLGLLLPCHQ
jgi:hypothetical protein